MKYVMLHDGYTVSEDFYKAVRYQAVEVIPVLVRGMKYTSRMLCGDEFWKLLTDGDKRMAGRCIANMVVSGLLPFNFAETKHEYPKRYQLH